MKTHFDVKELEKWKKEDLQKLASEMGLSDSGTKEEIAKRIAAEEVEVLEEEEPPHREKLNRKRKRRKCPKRTPKRAV